MTSFCFCGVWYYAPSQSFTREFGAWKAVSGQPKLWPLLGFSISIDIDFEDVRFLLVSPLAEGDLTRLSGDILRNKDQIFPYVSAFTLCHIHCPSNLIVSDPGHCPWLEDFAWFWHNSWWPSGSTSLVVIYSSHLFYFFFQSNILCYEGHCYLTDFGIPKSPTTSTPATSAQTVDRGWAAPELDQQTCSKQSDIFSFACTIYEVFVYFLDLSLLFTYLCALDLYPKAPL